MAASVETLSPPHHGLGGPGSQRPAFDPARGAMNKGKDAKSCAEEGQHTSSAFFSIAGSTLPKAFRQTKGVNGTALESGKLQATGMSSKRSRDSGLEESEAPGRGGKATKTSAAEDAGAATKVAAAKALPGNLELLAKIYDGLLISQALLLSRSGLCTFDRLRQPAENHCGRTIKLSHLRQIKYVFPAAVEWSWVRSREQGQQSEAEGVPKGRALKVALGPATKASAERTDAPGVAPVVMKRHRPAFQSRAMQASVEELRMRLREHRAAVANGGSTAADGEGGEPEEEEEEVFVDMSALPEDPALNTSAAVAAMSPVAPSGLKRTASAAASGRITPEKSILARSSSVSADFSEAAAEAAAAELDDEERQVRRASHGRRVSFGPVEQRLIPPRGSPAPAAFLSPATSAGLRLNDEPPPPGSTISQLHLHPLDPISDDEDDTGSSSSSSADGGSDDESVDDLETLACVGLMRASSGTLEDHVGEHLAALVRSNEGTLTEEEENKEKENDEEDDNNKENTQPGSSTSVLGAGASAAAGSLEEEDHQGAEAAEEPPHVCVIVPEAVRTGSAFSGDLPELSLEALEQLGAWEAEDNDRDDAAEAKARADSKARAALPRTFDLLQGVFGASGPCGLPMGTVLDRLCSTAAARRAVVGRGEAEDMLRALADAAPGYLTLAAGTPSSSIYLSSSKATTVRISRASATAELRQKLKAIADKQF